MNSARTWLPGCEPCVGCRQPRHATVGATPCAACGAVRWTLAVTGSRALTNGRQVREAARGALAELIEAFGCNPSLVLHGNAPGVDRILAARLHAAGWPVQAVPADWDTHGRKAGVLRDLSMVGRADALLALWDGTTAGTAHTIDLARNRGITVARRVITRHHHTRDGGQGDTQQRIRHGRHAPPQTPTTQHGRYDAPPAVARPGVMACPPATLTAVTGPQNRPNEERSAWGEGNGPSTEQGSRRLTVRTVGQGFHYAPHSASVWDFRQRRRAGRLQNSAPSPSATSARAPRSASAVRVRGLGA